MNLPSYSPEGFSTAILSPLQIHNPDYYNELFGKYPRASALSWLKAMGRSQPRTLPKRAAGNLTYRVAEETNAFQMAALVSTATNVVGATTVNLTIHPDYHSPRTGHSRAIRNATVLFPNQTIGFIESVNRTGAQDVALVKPAAGEDIQAAAAAAVAAAQPIVIYANAQPEASDRPEGIVPDIEEYENGLQVFRKNYPVTDLAMIPTTYFKINGTPHLYAKGIVDTAENFELEIELSQIINKKSVNLTDADQKGVNMFEGIIPAVRAEGGNFFYNPAATTPEPTLTTFENFVKMMTKIYGDRQYIGGIGQGLNIALQRFLVTFANESNTVVNFSQFPGGREQAVSLNFQWINYTNRQIMWQEWDVFNDPAILGANGHAYSDSGLFIPAGTVRNPTPTEGQPENVPYLVHVYADPQMPAPYNKGDHAVFETGMLASQGPTESKAARFYEFYGIQGFEIRARSKFIWFTPTGK